jgi:hypothetical protein
MVGIMRPGTLRLSALLIWILALSAPGLARAGDLDGDYRVEGTSPDGKAYAGDVRIHSLGGAQAVLWKLQSGEAYKGLGLVVDGVLGVAYGGAETNFGVVVYRIDGGKLDGSWTSPQLAKGPAGREVLEGSPDLAGEYRITLGENPDGTTNYDGTVKIQKQGDVYVMAWFVPGPTPSAVGFGVRQDDVLAVVYGSNVKGVGVVAYVQDGEMLSGLWSNGRKTLGRETLTRKP